MASSPSIASTRIAAAKASTKASAKSGAKPGLLAEMLRLWHEHNRRVAQFGMPPL